MLAFLKLSRYHVSYIKYTFIRYLPIYLNGTCKGLLDLSSKAAAHVNLGLYVNLLKSSNKDISQNLNGKKIDKIILDISYLIKKENVEIFFEKLI